MRATDQLRTGRSALCALLLCCPLVARAEAGGFEPASAGEAQPVPQRLAITVITSEAIIATFQERVSSWFSDGTLVTVKVQNELDSRRLLAAAAGEVSACIVPLSPERAVVIFAGDSTRADAHYLVREVRLRSGLDDLGLERLASVIHSAFVALREGAEGFEREHVERELREMGLAPAPPPAPAAAQATPAPVVIAPRLTPAPDAAPAPQHVAARAALLLAFGYGARLRGAEGLGHGPSLGAGIGLPRTSLPIELWGAAHFLLPTSFEAGSFDTSLQTTALRLRLGVAPTLGASYRLQALAGAGADVARIHTFFVGSSSESNVSTLARAPGTQWRGAGDVSLGVVRASQGLELELSAQVTFLFADVHYSVVTEQGERRLSAPWSVEPSLSVSTRLRSAL